MHITADREFGKCIEVHSRICLEVQEGVKQNALVGATAGRQFI